MKMTAAQVVETSVTANISWDLNSAAGEKRRGKNGLAVQSARFALGLFWLFPCYGGWSQANVNNSQGLRSPGRS